MKRFCVLFLLLLLCACTKAAEVPPVQETARPTAAPTVAPSSTAAPVSVTVTKVPVTDAPVTSTPAPTPEPTPEDTPAPQETAIPAETPPSTPSPRIVREDLSAQCTFRCSVEDVPRYLFTDNNLRSSAILAEGASVSFAWEADLPARSAYLFSYVLPDSFTVVQKDGQGAVLQQEKLVPEKMHSLIPLADGCRSVTLISNGRCKLNAFQIFGEGNAFPEKTVWWDEPKEYCELLLVSTHFDDEILMMGGVFPTYAGNQHRDCAIIYTVNEDNRMRQMEAMQGLWEMGVKREPIALSFDYSSMNKALNNDARGVFRKDDLATMVGLIRRLRPLVVVTHDVDGEYGHQEHRKTSALVRRAVELASDPAYDPDSVKEYGVWQVQKEYIHMWKENPLLLDVKAPLENMDGRSALQVAKDAFAFHKSQQKWSVAVQNRRNPIGQYGLYFSAVGPDSGINDMFENVVPPTLPLS